MRKRNTSGPYETVRKQNNKRNVARSDATTKNLKGDTVNDKVSSSALHACAHRYFSQMRKKK